jgi:hypothetical protein
MDRQSPKTWSTDVGFAEALEAAAKAGFEHVAIDHGGEQLTAEVSDGAGRGARRVVAQ